MKFPAIALGLLVLTAIARAEEPPSQWRFTEATLFDLIQNNYTIVAVTSGAARNGASAEDTFFLQKTNSVFKCFESRDAGPNARRNTGAVECYELTKPGASTPGK
jgi:hypothetical protein